MIKNITANYSVTIFFIYDAVFFSYDTIFFIYDASFFLYDTVFFIYDASFFLYDTNIFIYDAVFFCLVMTFFLLDTAFFSFFAISVHFIAINGILSIISATHNAKFPHRNIIRWGFRLLFRWTPPRRWSPSKHYPPPITQNSPTEILFDEGILHYGFENVFTYGI